MTEQEKYFKQNELNSMVIERDQLNIKISDLEMEIKLGEAENETCNTVN